MLSLILFHPVSRSVLAYLFLLLGIDKIHSFYPQHLIFCIFFFKLIRFGDIINIDGIVFICFICFVKLYFKLPVIVSIF